KKKSKPKRRKVDQKNNSNVETEQLETEPLPLNDPPAQQIVPPEENLQLLDQGLRLRLQSVFDEIGGALALATDLNLDIDSMELLQDKRQTLEALILDKVIEAETASELLESVEEP